MEQCRRTEERFSLLFPQWRFLCLRESAPLRGVSQFNREHAGESILYLWVEKIREFLVEKSRSPDTGEPGDFTLDGMTLLSWSDFSFRFSGLVCCFS